MSPKVSPVLLPLLLTGCVPIAYVYPTVGFVPPAPLGAPSDEVRAFRVELTKESAGGAPQVFMTGLKEVAPRLPDHAPGQAQFALDSGEFVQTPEAVSGRPPGWSRTRHAVEVRLYRPGWQTACLRSWQWPEQVAWRAAPTVAEREKAVDQLLFGRDAPRDPAAGGKDNVLSDWDGSCAALQPGSSSAAHREALLFAAGEYDCLAAEAASLTGDEGQRVRLILKAQRLREIADR